MKEKLGVPLAWKLDLGAARSQFADVRQFA